MYRGSGRRPSDLYEKSFTRFRNTRRPKAESSDDIPLQSKSDLAYETMYDDDEIVDTAQTMPWFDPKYLASGRDEVSRAGGRGQGEEGAGGRDMGEGEGAGAGGWGQGQGCVPGKA